MAEEAAERLSREIKICLSRVASAAKAVIHSTRLAARLKAAPFQNKCKTGFFCNLLGEVSDILNPRVIAHAESM